MARKALRQHEAKISDSVKDNPKVFWKYVKIQNQNICVGFVYGGLQREITKADQEKASTLADFFTSVFTIESDRELPDLDIKGWPRLDILYIDGEMVRRKLESLKIDEWLSH